MNWTISKAASEWGIDRRTLERRLKAAGWEVNPRDEWTTKDISAAIYGELELERIRKTREEADKLELDNAERRKDLITAEDAKEIFGRPLEPIARSLKDMPSRLANRVNPGDPILAREELEEYAREVCQMVQEVMSK